MTTPQHSAINTSNHQDNKEKSAPMPPDFEAQIIDLQMHMAHLELTVERLNDIVTQQDQHIRELQRQLQLIYREMENQNTDNSIAPFDVIADRPPHY